LSSPQLMDVQTPMVAGVEFDVSIIVVSFNTREVLRQCLQSVLDNARELDAEIIVVDNASSDGSPEMVEEYFPRVRLIRSSVNLGFAGGNNRALTEARGRYFVLLNSDAFFAPGALALAIRHMDETPECGPAPSIPCWTTQSYSPDWRRVSRVRGSSDASTEHGRTRQSRRRLIGCQARSLFCDRQP